MWFQDTTENRLMMSKAHGDELRAEASAQRMAKLAKSEGAVTIALSGRHFHFGSLVIVFGRTICEENTRHAGARA